MSDGAIIQMTWDGEVMRPSAPFWAKRADKAYVIGAQYRLVEEKERSSRSHKFYFSCINSTWENLTDELKERHPSPEHLRHWALIKAGWCDSQTIVLTTPEIAETVAAFTRPIDPFSVVTVRDTTVTIYTAKSQAYRAMDKADFRKSSDDVLRVLSEAIGVSVEQLGQAAREAA